MNNPTPISKSEIDTLKRLFKDTIAVLTPADRENLRSMLSKLSGIETNPPELPLKVTPFTDHSRVNVVTLYNPPSPEPHSRKYVRHKPYNTPKYIMKDGEALGEKKKRAWDLMESGVLTQQELCDKGKLNYGYAGYLLHAFRLAKKKLNPK